MLPIITGTGRLTADPELRFTPSGKAVANISLAFNSRKRNENGEYEDDKVFFVTGTVWDYVAEHAAESLTRGTEVVVTGRLHTEQYETREGEKRSAVRMQIDSIGPTLRFNPVRVLKAQRTDSPDTDTDSGE